MLLDVRRSLRRFPPGEKLSAPVALTFSRRCLSRELPSQHTAGPSVLLVHRVIFQLLRHTHTQTRTGSLSQEGFLWASRW